MDLNNLNRLIERVIDIQNHKQFYRDFDPLLRESLEECLQEIKLQYGSFLLEKLFDIYDDYFSDNEMRSIEEYLTSDGVEVDGDDFEEPHTRLTIRPYPLRFVVNGITKPFKEIIWTAA
ncbi:hypothetical protein [Marinoscillum sp. MHG1-6]|uniref:hypothetical protein n=1 Tax=Marinoscillum sp. MHG1-6 TaxID=2959627 RepID=UPI0021572F00|nr:hypothetical protein [Marinoscillum sp. MHG1-6]